MTSWHKTGTHPFYIGMYIHIYTHIYVHKYTSQKECLHIFWVRDMSLKIATGRFGFIHSGWHTMALWLLFRSQCCLIPHGLVCDCCISTLLTTHDPTSWMSVLILSICRKPPLATGSARASPILLSPPVCPECIDHCRSGPRVLPQLEQTMVRPCAAWQEQDASVQKLGGPRIEWFWRIAWFLFLLCFLVRFVSFSFLL